MKRTLLFAFALLFATGMMAQNRAVFINQSFEDGSMPAGWTIAGAGTTNWSISPTNNAGGQANELHMTWSPQFNGVSRVVMPAVDLTGVSSVMVSFRHALDNYNGGHTLGIATSSDGGTTWNNGWTQNYSQSNSWTVSQEITTPDMGQANVKFCIFYSGNSYNMNEWYFDDIQIFALEDLDLGVNAVNMSNFIPTGDQTVSINVKNFGTTAITSVEATYEVEGFTPVTETFDVEIASLALADLEFTTPINLVPNTYHMTVTLNAVNGGEDDDANDNVVTKDFTVAHAFTQRFPMIEHFSSSTCGPCVQPNTLMHNFCNNNEGRYTYTKYQMNWPGNGDPYYTEEGGVRRTYYGVSGVPSAFLDGEDLNFSGVQNTFNQHAEKYGFFDVRGSFAVEGNTITVKADVIPYIDVTARVFISVNEKETHNNVGTNGETSFHHIFMKMLTSTQGENFNFSVGEVQHFEYTQDMSSTNVEEMSDLEVAIWVQNYNSKEVYNSHYAYEYTDLYPYAVENLTYTASGTDFVASWDAPAQGTPTGYNVYVNNELVAENITETQYTHEGIAGNYYVVGVVALYGEMSSVKTIAATQSDMTDQGLITEQQSVALNAENPDAELVATNANHNTQESINILSIEEVNAEGTQYLTISAEELPYALPYGQSLSIIIAPNAPEAKSVAQTKVVVTSDAGTLEFEVTVDGELLSINETNAQTKIYPNPANSNVRIEAKNVIESVNVYNMMGALVETVPANGNSINVNTANLSNGVYFFNIRQNDGTVSNQRVVVSH